MPLSDRKRLFARTTQIDRCPVNEKLKCHETAAGRRASLVWGFVDDRGVPINLGVDHTSDSESLSTSDSLSMDYPYTFILRIREVTGYCPQTNPIVEVPVTLDDPISGVVISDYIPSTIYEKAGVYQEEWGILEDGHLVYTNSCYLFVRRGLFSQAATGNEFETGPPTIEEIRLSLRDHVAENQLLQNTEFDAAEIVQAIIRPIQHWNEIPPPLQPLQTTITFPFREMWLLGIQAHLLEVASHHYRRNQLAYSAGGVAIDDRNKDNPYYQVARNLWSQFEATCKRKKMEINYQLAADVIHSPYARYFY